MEVTSKKLKEFVVLDFHYCLISSIGALGFELRHFFNWRGLLIKLLLRVAAIYFCKKMKFNFQVFLSEIQSTP